MTLPRILFVDDERDLLDGLRNVLRADRRKWDMVFALGAEEAFAEMARATVDIVISDMRMPRVDGTALLAEVRKRSPGTVRIILSGEAEKDAILGVVPHAHQYLGKPSDPAKLRSTIDRIVAARARLAATVPAHVAAADGLPSPPGSYWALIHALEDPETGTREIADIVGRDAAMTSKVLQIVNSAYFGRPQAVTSVERAVAHLGTGLVRSVAVASKVFGMVEGTGAPLAESQEHGMLVGRRAATAFSDARRDHAQTAGLLHDIGSLVMRAPPVAGSDVDGHAAVGGYLLTLWGLPEALTDTVTLHHTPRAYESPHADIVAAVHLADSLTEVGGEAGLDEAFVAEHLPPDAIERVREACRGAT